MMVLSGLFYLFALTHVVQYGSAKHIILLYFIYLLFSFRSRRKMSSGPSREILCASEMLLVLLEKSPYLKQTG